MPIVGTWYKAEHSPMSDSGMVGGAIDTGAPLTGYLGEVFPPGVSPLLGQNDYVRYRKIFFRNEGGLDIWQTKAFFAALQHVDQMRFAFEKTAGDTTTAGTTIPAGYTTGDFISPLGYVEGVEIPPDGFLTGALGTLGFWLEQRIHPGLPGEQGAVARLGIGGVI